MSQRFTNPRAALAAVAGLCVLVTACSSPSASQPGSAPTTNIAPTTAAAAPAAPAPTALVATSAPAATNVPASVPTAVARPTQTSGAASAQATSPATAVQTAAAALTSTGTAVRLVLDGSASQASYHAHEQLVGKTLASEAVGTTPGVSGSLVLGADGSVTPDQSTITVDLTQLKSDESRRDNFIKTDTLQTSRYPTATFVADQVQGLPTPLPTSGEATFQLLGNLTVHGVTKPVTWQITAQFTDTTISGTATTSVNITDFGMTPPKVGPVLNIEDALNLQLAFTANRGA
jgi:polyisoprenoid-binding protein YceI